MIYKIGKVADFFGMTTETMRNYERAGLITSTKKEGSPLRYFDIEMLGKMVGIRLERSIGMSIRELQKIYTDTDEATMQNMMQEKITQQEHAIRRARLILEQTRWLEHQVDNVVRGETPFKTVDRPEMYMLCYRRENMLETLNVSDERLKTWTENLLLVQNLAYYPTLHVQHNHVGEFSVALAVEKRYAEALELNISSPVQLLPGGRYLRCSLLRETQSLPFGGQEEAISHFMSDNCLHQRNGMSYSISTFAFHRNGQKQSYTYLYIPID